MFGGFRVWGLGCGVWVLGFEVYGSGFGVQGLEFSSGTAKLTVICSDNGKENGLGFRGSKEYGE